MTRVGYVLALLGDRVGGWRVVPVRCRLHALCRGCPCQHRRPPPDPARELRRSARQKVVDGQEMTLDEARAWLADDGLCACVGGRGCCVNVAAAARAVLEIEEESCS